MDFCNRCGLSLVECRKARRQGGPCCGGCDHRAREARYPRPFKAVRGGGRVGIYFRTPLSDGQKLALRLEFVGAHPSPDGFNYRYREAT